MGCRASSPRLPRSRRGATSTVALRRALLVAGFGPSRRDPEFFSHGPCIMLTICATISSAAACFSWTFSGMARSASLFNHDVNHHGPLLPEPPAPADRLIELLVGVRQPDEHHLGARLPVHAEPCDLRLRHDAPRISAAEIEHARRLHVFSVGPAHGDGTMDRRFERIALVVQLTTTSTLVIGVVRDVRRDRDAGRKSRTASTALPSSASTGMPKSSPSRTMFAATSWILISSGGRL